MRECLARMNSGLGPVKVNVDNLSEEKSTQTVL